ncbi:MAG: glycosyltransferase family 2 protein [Rhizobiaceae bacterium]|nr:glycosyltransferase family 2 protein [Rhizobiaceae bacterium]
MSDRPKITVVTPSYNRRHAVLRAIASVQAQTADEFEHIVVDDGSTDGTAEAVRQVGDPRLRLVVLPSRQGANAARNAGVEAASSPLIGFLDSDDVYLPHRLRSVLHRFDADPTLNLLISSFETTRGSKRSRSVNREGFVDGATLESALVMQVIYIAGSAITVRRDVLAAAGGFDPEVPRLQDREVLLRLARRTGAQLSAEIDWLKHTSTDSISGHPEGYIQAYALLMEKHPQIRAAYGDVVRGTVARHLMKALSKRRFAEAWHDFRFNRQARGLGFSATELTACLLSTRRDRQMLRERLREARPA